MSPCAEVLDCGISCHLVNVKIVQRVHGSVTVLNSLSLPLCENGSDYPDDPTLRVHVRVECGDKED